MEIYTLPQAVTLGSRFREVSSSNLTRNTGCSRWRVSWLSPVPKRKCRERTANYATTNSFFVLSVFKNQLTIGLEMVETVVKLTTDNLNKQGTLCQQA
jgi:hypothetical protein